MIKKSALFSAIAAEMKKLGFKRHKSNYEFLLALGPGFEGHCSLADSTHHEKDAIWIGTFVGIRCEEIERRIADWCGEVVPGWDGSYTPTVSANLGYFSDRADWLEHRVDLAADSVEDAVRATLAEVKDSGLGFLRSHASYRGVIEALELGKGQLATRVVERLPLAHALAGDLDAARRALEPMRQEIAEGSLGSIRYLRFLDGFDTEFSK